MVDLHQLTPSGIYKFYQKKLNTSSKPNPEICWFVCWFCQARANILLGSPLWTLQKCQQCKNYLHANELFSKLFSHQNTGMNYFKKVHGFHGFPLTPSPVGPALPSMQPQPGGVKRSQHETWRNGRRWIEFCSTFLTKTVTSLEEHPLLCLNACLGGTKTWLLIWNATLQMWVQKTLRT